MFSIWETSILFSEATASFYISTSNVWEFQFLHMLAKLCVWTIGYCPSFLFCCPSEHEVVPYCSFDLCFPND